MAAETRTHEELPRRVKHLDAVVERVRHDDRPIGAYCHAPGLKELPRAGALTAEGKQKLPGCVKDPDAAAVRSHHDDRSVGAHRHGGGDVELPVVGALAA